MVASDYRMIPFLQAVERHHELAELIIKAVGASVALGGAVWVAVEYFADRKAERQKAELNLRRKAYFDYFTAIHLQLADLGEFFNDRRVPAVPPDSFKALHHLH